LWDDNGRKTSIHKTISNQNKSWSESISDLSVSFSQEKQKIRFFPLFLVVGLEKVALPSFMFWQLVMRQATQTWLRVEGEMVSLCGFRAEGRSGIGEGNAT
jgi:hypothetical protein